VRDDSPEAKAYAASLAERQLLIDKQTAVIAERQLLIDKQAAVISWQARVRIDLHRPEKLPSLAPFALRATMTLLVGRPDRRVPACAREVSGGPVGDAAGGGAVGGSSRAAGRRARVAAEPPPHTEPERDRGLVAAAAAAAAARQGRHRRDRLLPLRRPTSRAGCRRSAERTVRGRRLERGRRRRR
jgi:hypothetical protein